MSDSQSFERDAHVYPPPAGGSIASGGDLTSMGVLQRIGNSTLLKKLPHFTPYGLSPKLPQRLESRAERLNNVSQPDSSPPRSQSNLQDTRTPSSQPQSNAQCTPIPPPSSQPLSDAQSTPIPSPSPQLQSNVQNIPIPPPFSQSQSNVQNTPIPSPSPQLQSNVQNIPIPPPFSQSQSNVQNTPIPSPSPQLQSNIQNIPIPPPFSQSQSNVQNTPIPPFSQSQSNVQSTPIPLPSPQPQSNVQNTPIPSTSPQPQSNVNLQIPSFRSQPTVQSTPIPLPSSQTQSNVQSTQIPSSQRDSSSPISQIPTPTPSQTPAFIPSSQPDSRVHAHSQHLHSPEHVAPAGSSIEPNQRTAMTGEYILAILDERDKYTRRTLIAEIRTLLSPVLGPPPPADPPLLTYERILDIIRPCVSGQSSGRGDFDVNMDEPPANEAEVAKMLFDLIEEARSLAPGWTVRPTVNVPVHPSTLEDHAQPLQVPNDAPAPSSPIEADDEDEELPVAYTGYTPKSPTRIAFLKRLRHFLIAEQVRLPSSKRKGSLPACATQHEVTSFCNDQSCRPNQDRIVMAWFQPLTSEWNAECIALLAQKAQSALRASVAAGEIPGVEKDWLSIDSLIVQVGRSLKFMKDTMTPRIQPPSMLSTPPSSSSTPSSAKAALAAARARRRPRKTRKAKDRSEICQYVNDRYAEQPLRAALGAILAVGADGMSGEDTDDEDIQDSTTNQEKALVRVPVRWINPELMEMFHVVDTWKSFKQQELLAGGDLRGNKSLKRNHRDKPPAIGTVKRKLPRNWYEDTWFKSLPAGQQGKLNVMPYRPIPTPPRFRRPGEI